MKAFISLLLLSAMLMLTSATSTAAVWAMNGSSCTPDPLYIRNEAFYLSGPAIVVESSTAVFRCPVAMHPLVEPVQLSVVTEGTFAPDVGAQTIVELMAVDRNTGVETAITTFKATSGALHTTDGPIFHHIFNFNANFYYVKVILSAGSEGHRQVLYGAAFRP
jgi:hypothetical protein